MHCAILERVTTRLESSFLRIMLINSLRAPDADDAAMGRIPDDAQPVTALAKRHENAAIRARSVEISGRREQTLDTRDVRRVQANATFTRATDEMGMTAKGAQRIMRHHPLRMVGPGFLPAAGASPCSHGRDQCRSCDQGQPG